MELFEAKPKLSTLTSAFRIKLPVKKFSESLGFIVKWNRKTKEVSVINPGIKCYSKIGDNYMDINGKKIFEIATFIKNNRVYVSYSVIANLVAAKYGNSLDYLLKE